MSSPEGESITLVGIRHGLADHNFSTDIFFGGRAQDSGLTEKGRTEVKNLGSYIKKHRSNGNSFFDLVYSSPQPRALDSARILCICLGIEPAKIIVAPELIERTLGDWEGLEKSVVLTEAVKHQIALDPYRFRCPNGESYEDAEKRIMGWVNQEIIGGKRRRFKTEINPRIAMVSHGDLLRCWLRGSLDFDPKYITENIFDNASMTTLVYKDGLWQLEEANFSASSNHSYLCLPASV